jgi:hypothetical protein
MCIDIEDCGVELGLGNRFRRSLRRGIMSWLISGIEARGFQATDPALFDQDSIEDEAERLAEDVINRLTVDFRNQAPSWVPDCYPESVAEWLRVSLDENLEQVKKEFEDNTLFGWHFLISEAAGAPLEIAGTGVVIDPHPDASEGQMLKPETNT